MIEGQIILSLYYIRVSYKATVSLFRTFSIFHFAPRLTSAEF